MVRAFHLTRIALFGAAFLLTVPRGKRAYGRTPDQTGA